MTLASYCGNQSKFFLSGFKRTQAIKPNIVIQRIDPLKVIGRLPGNLSGIKPSRCPKAVQPKFGACVPVLKIEKAIGNRTTQVFPAAELEQLIPWSIEKMCSVKDAFRTITREESLENYHRPVCNTSFQESGAIAKLILNENSDKKMSLINKFIITVEDTDSTRYPKSPSARICEIWKNASDDVCFRRVNRGEGHTEVYLVTGPHKDTPESTFTGQAQPDETPLSDEKTLKYLLRLSDEKTLKYLMMIGFTGEEAKNLIQLGKNVGSNPEIKEILAAKHRQEFVRWLVEHGKLTEQIND